MIWNEELSASLDHATGVVVFHRVEVTRSHQLAQVLADKLSAMVEQNEKSLDQKLGNATPWNDRGDGQKGDKRGEQTQERRRGGERRGGMRGTQHRLYSFTDATDIPFQVVLAEAGVPVLHKAWAAKCRVHREVVDDVFLSVFLCLSFMYHDCNQCYRTCSLIGNARMRDCYVCSGDVLMLIANSDYRLSTFVI